MEKRFYRSREDKKIAGVCGGVAEYFEVDPTLVRLAWVVFTFAGAGILAYIIAAIIMPEKPLITYEEDSVIQVVEDEKKSEEKKNPTTNNNNIAIGIVLMVLGSLFISRNLFRIHWINFNYVWPMALVLVGFYIIAKHKN